MIFNPILYFGVYLLWKISDKNLCFYLRFRPVEDCQDEDCLSECRDFHKLEEGPLEYCEARSCKAEGRLREWECLVECTPGWSDWRLVWLTGPSRDCWEDS